MRQANRWAEFARELADVRTGGPQVPDPSLTLDVGQLRDLKFLARSVVLKGVNVPTPLTPDESELVEGLTITAGPQADGTTANVSTLWLGGPDLQLDASGKVINGVPIAPGGARDFDGRVDLAQLRILSATAADLARIGFMVPA